MHGIGVSVWDVGNILFQADIRMKCMLNRKCTPFEDLVDVIVYHNYMKGK